jgi:hypothetical protein
LKNMTLLKYLPNISCFFMVLGLACQPEPTKDNVPNATDAGYTVISVDGGMTETEAPIPDAGTNNETPQPTTGFGAITGDCGILTAAILSQSNALMIQNAIDFENDPYDDSDFELLTEGGQEIIDDGNAGGSSLLSEVFSYEVLYRCEGAELLKTEMEVTYTDPSGKLTDLLVDFDGTKIGVSVTRAIGWPREDPYTVASAQNILEQKLQGVLDSTANVAPADAWQKQILHVIAYGEEHAISLATAFDAVDASLKSNTIIWVTVSHGDDEFLY